MTGRTGGTVSFNGNISATGRHGIDVTGNTGGTIRFNGSQNLSTGANTAVNLREQHRRDDQFHRTGGNGLDITTTTASASTPPAAAR